VILAEYIGIYPLKESTDKISIATFQNSPLRLLPSVSGIAVFTYFLKIGQESVHLSSAEIYNVDFI
jgi:hypothetical protein